MTDRGDRSLKTSQEADLVSRQVSGIVTDWDRSEGKGEITDQEGNRHRVSGSNVDSPIIGEGYDVKFDIVESDPDGETVAKRVIVQISDDSETSPDQLAETESTESADADIDATQAFSEWPGIFAGFTALLISVATFAFLASTLTSFPVFAASIVLYGTNVTYPVWGCIFVAAGFGAAIATTYWYGVRVDPLLRDESLGGTFIGVFGATLLVTVPFGLLRSVNSFLMLLLVLVLVIGGPLLFLASVAKANGPAIVWSLVLLGGWAACIEIVGVDSLTLSQISILISVVGISGCTMVIPGLVGVQNVNTERMERFEKADSLLSATLQGLNQSMFASHGLDIPSSSMSLSEILHYDGQLSVETVRKGEAIAKYYQEISNLEDQLSAIASLTGTPTDVTRNVCEIIDAHGPTERDGPLSEQLAVVDQFIKLLKVYERLLNVNDREGCEELADRLDDLSEQSSTMSARDLEASVEDLISWASQRARKRELMTKRSTIEERWNESVGDMVGLDISNIDGLEDTQDSTVAETEAALETADRVIALTKRVQSLQVLRSDPPMDPLAEIIDDVVTESGPDTDLEFLDQLVDLVESILTARNDHHSYPFDHLLSTVLYRAGERTLDLEAIAAGEMLVEDATTVLEFLETTDTNHPSIDAEEWRKSVRIGLKNFSPEIVQPPAQQVERMGETLWERSHLSEFTWEEFEHLVASVLDSQGYETKVTQSTSDGGIDVWARKGGIRTAVQVKQFSSGNNVGRPDLQKLASTIAKGDADRAMVVTSSNFARTARNYAADFGPNIQLVDGEELVKMLSESDIPPPVDDSRGNWEDL